MTQSRNEIAAQFQIEEGERSIVRFGDGHINETYLVTLEGVPRRYILQKLSAVVFPEPEKVIENIERVTRFLREKIVKAGGDPDRETLQLIPTREGAPFVRDADGAVWRMYLYIEQTVSKNLPDTPELFALSGKAFGKFQRQLSDFPARDLHEVIPHFHDTPSRFARLLEAIRKDPLGRAAQVQKEIDFCLAREQDTRALLDLVDRGEIPLRVTHNDTKLNNVLLDAHTGEGVCVIDLDTVMPGLAAYDFGDSIRFGANTALEDEQDLSRVSLSLPMFQAFAEGFLSEAGSTLLPREIETLPLGAKLMTLECGMRFLTDHLEGDRYFRIHRQNHNLDRARTQFALVADMETKWGEMQAIAERAAR